MKQHNIHNDEAIYQKILAELVPGAEEYDKLIAEGKHPAAKIHRTIPYHKYAAAACVLLAVAGGTLLWQQRDNETKEHKMAEVEEKVNDTPGCLLAQETPPPSIKAELAVLKKVENTSDKAVSAKTQQVLTNKSVGSSVPESVTESDMASNGNNTEAELLPAIFNEIESRMALERLHKENLHRAAIEEVYAHIVENPDGPQLTL